MFCKNNLEYKTFMKLFCKGQFLILISGEDRDEPLLPMVGEEIEIEAKESQDQEVRDDYEHEADVDPIHDPLANVTKKSDIHWHHTSFIPVDTTWESPTTDPREPLTLHDVAGQKRVAMERRPVLEVQTDMVDHMPNYDGKKEATRCKLRGCSGKTHVFCDKCKVHYCFVLQRNCFKDAHRK